MIRTILHRVLGWIDQQPFTWAGYLITIATILFIRLLLEYFSSSSDFVFNVYSKFDGLHSIFWFISLKATMILILSGVTGRSVTATAHVFSFFFPVIFVAPVLDIAFSGGLGTQMTYLHPQSWSEAVDGFFRFMQSEEFGQGATIGLTIEVAMILIGVAVYCWGVTGSLMMGVVGLLLSYVAIYSYAIFPFLVFAVFNTASLAVDMSFGSFNRIAVFMLALLFVFQSLLIGGIAYSRKFLILVRDIRALRILHYVAVFLFGGAFVLIRFRVDANAEMLLRAMLIFVSFVLVVVHAIVTNNVQDVEVDKISNADRPLITGGIDSREYAQIGNVALIIGLLLGYVVGFYNFFFLFLFAGGYYLYSCPPFRLKRIPLLSKMYLGCISLSVFMWGFLFFSDDGVLSFGRFPYEMIVFFVVIGGLIGNYIDLKDIEGDRKAGIMTLPVLLGGSMTKHIIAFGALAGFVMLYFIFGIERLVYVFPGGIALFLFFLYRKPYVEKYLLWSYLGMLFAGAYIMYAKFDPDTFLHNILIP